MPSMAPEYRRQAMRCAAEADKVPNVEQREQLMKMREAFLTLAENEDWLSGRQSPLRDGPQEQRRTG